MTDATCPLCHHPHLDYDDEACVSCGCEGPVRTEPTPPPYAIGDQVRYIGKNAFRYNDNPMVETGDVGTVIANTEGQVGRPDLGPEFAQALDGWSTLDIKGNRLALHVGDDDRYERVR